MSRARWFVPLALAGLIGSSLWFVGEGSAVGGTLVACGNTTAAAGKGAFSPGLKKTEIGQSFHAKYGMTDCVADATQLANALPSKHGVAAAQANQINTAFAGLNLSTWADCLVNGVTTGGDPNTDNEYPLQGKLGIKWLDANGSSIGGVTPSRAFVRADLESTFPPRLDVHGIVTQGLGIGADISATVEIEPVVGDTSLSDCFVNGDPGAIVKAVQVTAVNSLSISLP